MFQIFGKTALWFLYNSNACPLKGSHFLTHHHCRLPGCRTSAQPRFPTQPHIQIEAGFNAQEFRCNARRLFQRFVRGNQIGRTSGFRRTAIRADTVEIKPSTITGRLSAAHPSMTPAMPLISSPPTFGHINRV